MKAMTLIIASLLLIALALSYYRWFVHKDDIAPLTPSLQLVGVIDFNNDHKMNISELKAGNDILLVLDKTGFLSVFVPSHPEFAAAFAKPFDLINYDINQDGIIDNQDAIWPYLHVVVYSDDGAAYQVRHLEDAGIHAILTPHLTTQGNHRVLLTDGDTRILYETPSFQIGSSSTTN